MCLLHLDHVKVGLADTAVRTLPIRGDVVPTRSRCNPFFRQALAFVIHKTTNLADPFFHAGSYTIGLILFDNQVYHRYDGHRMKNLQGITTRYFLLGLGLLLLSLLMSPTLHAANTRVVISPDQAQITVQIYPAEGKLLLIWLTNEAGVQAIDHELAKQLADRDVEVWIPELLDAYFMPTTESGMDRIPDVAVAALLDAASASGKSLILAGSGRAAIPLLSGARYWQLHHPQNSQLRGATLMSPILYTETPDAGQTGKLMPIVEASNLKLVILQPDKSPWYWKIPDITAALHKGGSEVAVWRQANLRDRYYFRPDAVDVEKDATRLLAQTLYQTVVQLNSSDAKDRVAVAKIKKAPPVREGKKDRVLAAYSGDPNPPALNLPTLNKKSIDLAKQHDKVVIVNFWASWCPPCVHEMPSMQRLQQHYAKQPFMILGVNMAEDTTTIQKFVNERVKVTFPILLDKDGAALQRWKVFAFPTTYVIDKKGRIRYALFGGVEWDTPDIIKKIDALLKE